MAIALFALIAWVTLIIFMLIPKSLTTNENIIVFFCITIVAVSAYTLKDTNFKLVDYNRKPEMYISLLMHRTIIITFCLMIFVNLHNLLHMRYAKVAISVITLLVLYFTELLTVLTGLKVYIHWNSFFAAINLVAHMVISILLMKLIKRIPEGS